MSSFKVETYDDIARSLKGLTSAPLTWESGLVSLIALLKVAFPAISWIGFYRDCGGGELWVGPYQGPLACVRLKPGQGVCGASFQRRATVIVEDVHAFAGHVACDPAARSEIVLPVYRAGQLVGVLDLDSHQPAAFDATDQRELERLLKDIERLPERVII